MNKCTLDSNNFQKILKQNFQMMKRSDLKTNIKNYFLKQYNDQCKYFLFPFFSCPFSLSSSSFISLLFFTWPVTFLCCASSPKDNHLSLTYSSLILTIYEENMLIHQASLKESICEKNVFYNLHRNRCCSPSTF